MSKGRAFLPITGPSYPNYAQLFPKITGPITPMTENPSPPEAESMQQQEGAGVVDKLIGLLPGEFHLTDEGDDGIVRKDEWCGPGTDVEKRLARGDKGINELDRYCKDHDIAYSKYKTAKLRHPADHVLAENASRIANDPTKPERQRRTAKKVAAIISTKAFLGLGVVPKKRRRKLYK